MALQHQNVAELRRLVQENHRLLVAIGVVPDRVQRFVREIESIGAAAKFVGQVLLRVIMPALFWSSVKIKMRLTRVVNNMGMS